MKKHLQLVSIGRNPHRIRTVCGCGNVTAVFVADVTCRRCLQSAARLIDDELAEVSKIYRVAKDKTRTVIGEELALRCQNAIGHAPGAHGKAKEPQLES